MPEVGISGLIVILVVALLVFGPKRLPEIGRSLGRGMREFKDSIAGSETPDSSPETLSVEPGKDAAVAPASGQAEGPFCTACGAEARPDDRFCSSCGTAITHSQQALTG
jgi:sec-independent protein translocase protein TatA